MLKKNVVMNSIDSSEETLYSTDELSDSDDMHDLSDSQSPSEESFDNYDNSDNSNISDNSNSDNSNISNNSNNSCKKRKRDDDNGNSTKYNFRKRSKIDYNDDISYRDEPLNNLAKQILNSIHSRSNQSNKITKEHKPLYDEILKEIKDRMITETHILQSHLTFKDKVEMMELLRVMQNIEPDTEEWLHLKIKLYEKIKKATPLTEDDMKIADTLKNINNDELSIEHKILRSKHPDKIKAIIYKKYQEIQYLDKGDESYYKILEWINVALELPTEIINFSNEYNSAIELLLQVNDHMNKNIYGQMRVKERILELTSAIYSNPHSNNRCVGLVGPPGVGKTSFARSLADGMGLPFYQISFGGMIDSAFLKGHNTAYIGSKPGAIVKALVDMGCQNGILFLDELDKIQESLHGKEVASSLLHILDYTQNSEFTDMYIQEIPIDLSKLLIVISINDPSVIDKVLLDRLPLIQLEGYNIDEKIKIGLNYMIPKIHKHLKIEPTEVIINENVMRYIVLKSNVGDPGVRQLERNLYNIFERINILKIINMNKKNNKRQITMSYNIKNFRIPFNLKEKHVDILLNSNDTDKSTTIYT
jgi:ATP-dependent Lon protease